MAFTSITLTAGSGYRTATGATPPVRIRARPLVEMTNGTIVVKDEVVIPFNSSGTATKPIYATTDPATTPAGNAYRFHVETPFGIERTFLAAVPHNAGSTVDIADLVELESPPGTGAAGSFALADATDVASTTPTDGQVLTYDIGTSQWGPADSSGAGGATDLADTPDLTRVVAYTSAGQSRPQWRGPVVWQGDVTTLGLPTNMIPEKDWTQDFGEATSGARYFDGVNPNYAYAGDSTSLRTPSTAITLAGFWRPSTYTATDGGLWGKTGNSVGRSMSYAVIRRDTTDARNLRFRLGLTTAGNVLIDPANMATTLSMNTWYFVACTWASGAAPRMRVWTVGGTSLIDTTGGTTYTDSIICGADQFRVGKNDQADTTGMHRCSLAAIGVHNAVLSDANLTSWRTNKVPPVTLSGGFWALNSADPDTELDTAQTNHLTLSGIVHTTGGP